MVISLVPKTGYPTATFSPSLSLTFSFFLSRWIRLSLALSLGRRLADRPGTPTRSGSRRSTSRAQRNGKSKSKKRIQADLQAAMLEKLITEAAELDKRLADEHLEVNYD